MDDRTAARVDRLFARLTVLYGHRFTAPIDDEALWELARQEWAAAVQALTDEQIRRGLDACKAGLREWPPAFGEFVRLALGLPDTYQAAALAAKGERDELSRLIRRETGDSYNVGMADSRSAQRMCERAYEGVVRGMVAQVNLGGPVEPAAYIEHALEHKQATEAIEDRTQRPASTAEIIDSAEQIRAAGQGVTPRG